MLSIDVFLSTLSLRRATGYGQYCIRARGISIHALLAESDSHLSKSNTSQRVFLSTLSLRRATKYHRVDRVRVYISIHALLAESDDVIAVMTDAQSISIHALLAESDASNQPERQARYDFYPRSPCGERPHYPQISIKLACISIHALLAESDQVEQTCRAKTSISIHALLAESDASNQPERQARYDFYPRSPCGERLVDALELANAMLFLSTLSLRRATSPFCVFWC